MTVRIKHNTSGAWTWFTDPRAIRAGDYTITGGVTPAGDVVTAYFKTGGPLQTTTLKSALDIDDHANPSFVVLPDGRIAAWYSAHNGSSIFQRITTSPGDPTQWGTEASLDAQFGLDLYTYTNPVVLGGDVHLFFRARTGAVTQYWHSVSSDNGTTWSSPEQLMVNNGDNSSFPPYVHVVKNGSGRIDFSCTDGHPGFTATNSLYHFFFDGTTFRDTAGNAMTTPITPLNDLTPVWNGSSERVWNWDIYPDSSGEPVIVFSTFVSTTDHKYRHARLQGGMWTVTKIADAGGFLYSGQPYYSGGMSIDPSDVMRVFGAVAEQNGFNLKSFSQDENGEWSSADLASTGEDIRPVALGGNGPRLFYLSGRYTTFEDFDTDIIIASLEFSDEEKFTASYADAGAADPKPTALIRPADVQRSIDTDVANLVGGPNLYVVEAIFDIGELENLNPYNPATGKPRVFFVRDDQPGLRQGKNLLLKSYQIRSADPSVPVTCTFWG